MNKTPKEHAEQVTLVAWFRETYPDILIFAIPNGGKRNINEAKKLKLEGVLSGVSDLFVPEYKLWIELKRIKGGKLSDEQEAFGAEMLRIGHKFIVAHGWIEAKTTIQKIII